MVFWIVDFMVAVMALVALSLTLVAVVSAINLLQRQVVIDLNFILQTLRSDPTDVSVWWIYAMIFSTFLPSFVHGCIALASLPLTHIVGRGWITKLLKAEAKGREQAEIDGQSQTHNSRITTIAWYFTIHRVFIFGGAVILIFVPALLVMLALPWIGGSILYWCELLAQSLGQSVIPVKPEITIPFFMDA
jgi:hypothetical protein